MFKKHTHTGKKNFSRRRVSIAYSSNLDGATALNHSHLGVYSLARVCHLMRLNEVGGFCLD
jgi:hypothetical protein